jgi:hypothetical protein
MVAFSLLAIPACGDADGGVDRGGGTGAAATATTAPARAAAPSVPSVPSVPSTTAPPSAPPPPSTTAPAPAPSPTSTPPSTSTSPPQPEVATGATQPAQPTSGPGGSDYANGDWRISEGGSGADAWYVFEPVSPQPTSAPLAIVVHGYFEYSGFDSLHELIRHTVRGGSIVIYPRWQTDLAVPCPGPIDIEPCLAAAVSAIRGGLDHLTADPSRVQPELDETSYFGFSFGGIIVANLANRHDELGLPAPRAIFLEDPHDGGVVGDDEPALDDSLAGIPAATLVVCHSSAGITAEKPGASCNTLFPRLAHIPDDNKDLVMIRADAHGTPALAASHGVCAAPPGKADAYDWNFCWRQWDALRSTALDGTDRRAALGDGAEHLDLGAWSDGVALVPLKVQDEAPIRP